MIFLGSQGYGHKQHLIGGIDDECLREVFFVDPNLIHEFRPLHTVDPAESVPEEGSVKHARMRRVCSLVLLSTVSGTPNVQYRCLV